MLETTQIYIYQVLMLTFVVWFATILTGRYIEIKVLPLSFSEWHLYLKVWTVILCSITIYATGHFIYIADLLAQGVRDISVYMDGIYDSVRLKMCKPVCAPVILVSLKTLCAICLTILEIQPALTRCRIRCNLMAIRYHTPL